MPGDPESSAATGAVHDQLAAASANYFPNFFGNGPVSSAAARKWRCRGWEMRGHDDLFKCHRRQAAWQRDIRGHRGCVNAIALDRSETLLVSGGDDLRVLIWRTADLVGQIRPRPAAIMQERHFSNIFTLAFNRFGDHVYSSGNDGYFYVHDVETGNRLWNYYASCIYSLSVCPDDDNIVAAGTDLGTVAFFDVRMEPSKPLRCISERSAVYCVNYNPAQKHQISVCNKEEGLTIYDDRFDKLFAVNAGTVSKNAIYSQWTSRGDSLVILRSDHQPLFWKTDREAPVVLRSTEGYSNSVTIKSCDVLNDEYAITGSDDWNIYVWRLPHDYDDIPVNGVNCIETEDTREAFAVFRGHRSIVNHAKAASKYPVMYSGGVEKIIKVWTMEQLPGSVKNPRRRKRLARYRVFSLDDDEEDDGDCSSEGEDLGTLRMFDRYLTEEYGDDTH